MADKKERTFKVREGKKFHAVVDGRNVTLYRGSLDGDTIKNLTDEQIAVFGDVFEETDESKRFYRADTPDGNPDTTHVVTSGVVDGRIASPTIPPAAAGQSAPVREEHKSKEEAKTAEVEPVASTTTPAAAAPAAGGAKT